MTLKGYPQSPEPTTIDFKAKTSLKEHVTRASMSPRSQRNSSRHEKLKNFIPEQREREYAIFGPEYG
jgi:hypothetical protein